MISENFRQIGNLTDYRVSDLGRVQRLKDDAWVELSYDINHGYLRVWIDGVRRRVHQLVLEAFVGECPEDQEVLHKNDIRHDNRLENLKYGTHSENMKQAASKGVRHGMTSLTESEVIEMRRLHDEEHVPISRVASKFQVRYRTAWSIITRRTWSHV